VLIPSPFTPEERLTVPINPDIPALDYAALVAEAVTQPAPAPAVSLQNYLRMQAAIYRQMKQPRALLVSLSLETLADDVANMGDPDDPAVFLDRAAVCVPGSRADHYDRMESNYVRVK
jgi:hypothetical protein